MEREASEAHLYDRAVRLLDAGAQPVPVSPCPVCDCREARPSFRVDGVAQPVVVCPDCGLARYEPLPSEEDVLAYYPESYYGQPGTKFRPLIEWLVRWVGERHARFLSRGLPPRSRVLDVGCGRGVILGALADRDLEVHGVEISAAAAQGADPRARIRIAPTLAEAGYPDGFFDEVIIWHVLEHLRDPRGTLEEVHRILRPDGRVIVAVPNFSSLQARWAGACWFHLDPPRHLFHFPLAALRRLLRRTGFASRFEHHFSLRQNPFGWIQSGLNRYTTLPRNGLYTLLHEQALDRPLPFDRRTRGKLLFWLVAGALPACALAVGETVLRRGATVHVVAHRM